MSRVLVVGSVALDSVETKAGRRDGILGGSASFSSVAASLLAPVRLVAVVGEDFPEEHIGFLRSRGIDIEGLSRRPGRTFRWSGRYSDDFSRRETLDTQLNVFESFDPQIPEAYRDSEVVFLANIDPRLQAKVLDQVRSPRIVAADTMNYWIAGARGQLLRVLERVDLLLLNDEEARQLSGEWNILKATRAVQSLGPRRVLVKRGEHGSLLLDGEDLFVCTGYPVGEVVDPTGAGDCFAGALLGWLARDSKRPGLREAVVCATAAGSFCVEGFGIDRLRTLTAEELRERMVALRRLVTV